MKRLATIALMLAALPALAGDLPIIAPLLAT